MLDPLFCPGVCRAGDRFLRDSLAVLQRARQDVLDRIGHQNLLVRRQRNDGIRRRLDRFDQVAVQDEGSSAEPRELNHDPSSVTSKKKESNWTLPNPSIAPQPRSEV